MWEMDHKQSWVPKNWCFWTVVLEKTCEVPWIARRSNQSIVKEISPEYSLEGLMLELKFQYFGHLMWITDSSEKTLMLGKTEGRRRRGWQRIRRLDGITNHQTHVHWIGDGHQAISSSVFPFSSCPQSLPASESFPMSQLFAWGGQRTGVSALASVLPKKSQGWSPLGWTSWVSLQSKGLSRSSPTPQFKSTNSSVLSFLHSPTLTSIHDHRKNHSLD